MLKSGLVGLVVGYYVGVNVVRLALREGVIGGTRGL